MKAAFITCVSNYVFARATAGCHRKILLYVKSIEHIPFGQICSEILVGEGLGTEPVYRALLRRIIMAAYKCNKWLLDTDKVFVVLFIHMQ